MKRQRKFSIQAKLTQDKVNSLANDYNDKTPQDVLQWALTTYGQRLTVSTSFQAEGIVILQMAHKIDPNVRVLTIDTGRLPQETHDLIDEIRERYKINVQVIYPDNDELSEMTTKYGTSPFYSSVSLRLLCCNIRKVNPINRALRDFDAWISGLRREQSDTRSHIRKIEIDVNNGGIIKVNPLADWTSEQVWDYIKINDLPYSKLYDEGYTSIGCAPCTRPTEPGEDVRAGRWWWEDGMPKECGIHLGGAWTRTS